jgi:hypothetical protein
MGVPEVELSKVNRANVDLNVDLLEAIGALLGACDWDDVIEVGGKPMRAALCKCLKAYEAHGQRALLSNGECHYCDGEGMVDRDGNPGGAFPCPECNALQIEDGSAVNHPSDHN